MKIYKGIETVFPIVKQTTNESWLCQLTSGNIHIVVNNEEFDLDATNEEVYFIILRRFAFKITDGSSNFSLNIVILNQDQLATIYSHLGKDVSARLLSNRLISSSRMGHDINDMLRLDFQQMKLLLKHTTLLKSNEMILYLVLHILLTLYNGLGRLKSNGSSRSFSIMDRFYALFQDKETFCHRDTQYFADRLNISVRYLFQVCQEVMGCTPKNLINEIIISEVRHTMLTTDLSLQQISNRFQFPDQAAFTQFFKRNSSITPTEFRKRYK